jgi:hypothetical protein
VHTLILATLLTLAPTPLAGPPSPQAAEGYLYQTVLLRAAPGRLLELIDLVTGRVAVHEAAGDQTPLILRHSQGDHWDLMLILPIESMAVFYTLARIEARARAAEAAGMSETAYRERLRELASWREETLYTGPSLERFRAAGAGAGYFHVEMFIALPGRFYELYRQREMENDYLGRIGRPLNLIFSKTLGGPWDLFTLGFYRDLKHFAESADVPADAEDRAARAAGFEGADRIGTYMRSLIDRHNDTIGGIIRPDR